MTEYEVFLNLLRFGNFHKHIHGGKSVLAGERLGTGLERHGQLFSDFFRYALGAKNTHGEGRMPVGGNREICPLGARN